MRRVSPTGERRRAVEDVIERVDGWALGRADIRAVALVGSWARGEASMASDVDLVVLSTEPHRYRTGDDWWDFVGPARPIRTRPWGLVIERRVGREGGLEIEFGIAGISWADVEPVDVGTAEVVRTGCRILYDPDRLLETLLEAL